jgi:hypothetical protein
MFAESCSENMQSLQAEYRWVGRIDLQMAGEAFAAGAAYGYRIANTKTDKKRL